MSLPVITLSDDDETDDILTTPLLYRPKKTRIASIDPIVIDDDPTPEKSKFSASTPTSVVPDTPLSELYEWKGNKRNSDPGGSTSFRNSDFPSSDSRLQGQDAIPVDSDNESGDGVEKEIFHVNVAGACSQSGKNSEGSLKFIEFSGGRREYMENDKQDSVIPQEIECNVMFIDSESPRITSSMEICSNSYSDLKSSEDDDSLKHPVDEDDKENIEQDAEGIACQEVKRKRRNSGEKGKKLMTKEEREQKMAEKKAKKREERLRREALKAEAAKMKQQEKDKRKWEKGKYATESIEAIIDPKVLEIRPIGGPLLSAFTEKKLKYSITSNPIEKSIIWTMKPPENVHVPHLSWSGTEIHYILFIYDAEEFCKLASSEALFKHISMVRSRHLSYTICILTNRLRSYINKREQEHYKNPGSTCWMRPPVEEVLAKLSAHFDKVHSRQCVDEAEIAEHVVGLTTSLANCKFRQKLTMLSVNANGSVVPKDCVERNLILKSPWLKALVSIPKVQPRFALAIAKEYPTMKSLLKVYMDPTKSVHEKEFLLQDLRTEGVLNDDRRLGEICSKRVYRILMAQNGNMKTDDVENGADIFDSQ